MRSRENRVAYSDRFTPPQLDGGEASGAQDEGLLLPVRGFALMPDLSHAKPTTAVPMIRTAANNIGQLLQNFGCSVARPPSGGSGAAGASPHRLQRGRNGRAAAGLHGPDGHVIH